MKNNTLIMPLQIVIDNIVDSFVFAGGIIFTIVLVTLSKKPSHNFKFQQKFSLRTQSGIV